MLKYLVIQIHDSSCSFCHYQKKINEHKIISIDHLRRGILFAMKENLMIHFILPDTPLPEGYIEEINNIDNFKIASTKSVYKDIADALVIDEILLLKNAENDISTYTLRVNKDDLFANYDTIIGSLEKVNRLNIILNDIDSYSSNDFSLYKDILDKLSSKIIELYRDKKFPQVNILTDLLNLDSMHNCNAGVESITLAPNGKFYICPGFYEDGEYDCGDLINGVKIKNQQLYHLTHAPICRICDSFQCNRCIWLNKKTTLEVNTPSHQQCVISHLERNASRKIFSALEQEIIFNRKSNIPEIDYLDPFDKIK